LDSVLALVVTTTGIVVLGEGYTRTALDDASSAADSRYPPTSAVLTEKNVRELEQGRLVVLTNVLTADTLKATQEDVRKLIQSMKTTDNDDDVRTDSVCWIREQDGAQGDGMNHCIKLLRGIPFLLERHGYDKSHSFVVPKQCQLAQYPPGGGYVRHVDRCLSTMVEMGLLGWWRASDYRNRTVTAILFLNDYQWSSGGHLRCFGNNRQGEEEYRDVNPAGGTLVIFDSARVEHMVLPATADRYALTCWINGVLA
jgi:hypothetical protein